MKDREAWCAAVHGFAKSLTRLSDWTDLLRQQNGEWPLGGEGQRQRPLGRLLQWSNEPWCSVYLCLSLSRSYFLSRTCMTCSVKVFVRLHPKSWFIQSLGICHGFTLHPSLLPEVWEQGKRKGGNENCHSPNQVLVTKATNSVLGLGWVFTSHLPHDKSLLISLISQETSAALGALCQE